MSYRILALADDGLLFDKAHAQHMKLPFDHGWAQWHVYHQTDSFRYLMYVDTFSTFAEAEAFVEMALLPPEPILSLREAQAIGRSYFR